MFKFRNNLKLICCYTGKISAVLLRFYILLPQNLHKKRVSDMFLIFPDLSRDSRNIEHIINKKYPQCMACLKNSTLAKTKLTKICFE